MRRRHVILPPFDWHSLRAQRHRAVRPRETALCRIVFPDGSWTLEVIPTHKDARFYPAGGDAPPEVDGYWQLEWKPNPERTGPKTKHAQDKIEKKLAELPPSLTNAEKAALLHVSESTVYRLLARKKS